MMQLWYEQGKSSAGGSGAEAASSSCSSSRGRGTQLQCLSRGQGSPHQLPILADAKSKDHRLYRRLVHAAGQACSTGQQRLLGAGFERPGGTCARVPRSPAGWRPANPPSGRERSVSQCHRAAVTAARCRLALACSRKLRSLHRLPGGSARRCSRCEHALRQPSAACPPAAGPLGRLTATALPLGPHLHTGCPLG